MARAVARPVPTVASAGGAAAFSPSDLGPLQWALDGGNAYESTTLDSYQPLRSLESYGTYRKPRSGRCYLFDGTDDYATIADTASLRLTGDLTIAFWIEFNSVSGTQFIITKESAAGWATGYSIFLLGGKVYFYAGNGSNAEGGVISATTISTGTRYRITATRSGTSYKIYINGSLDNSATYPGTVTDTGAATNVSKRNTGSSGFVSAKIHGIRFYNVAKNATEIAAIYNQASTPTTLDRTGLVAAYWCNEEAGTVAYDWSGNGKHLTLTNITTSTFHASDTGVTYNPANFLGCTVSGSTVIPRNEADTAKDAAGNALGNTGKCPHPAVVETPCITTDGAGTVYLDCPHLTGSETVVSSKGTATITVSAGKLSFDASKTVAEIVLSDGTHYVCCEGAGTDGTNRTVYDVSDGANHATLTNGTLATVWGSRLAGIAQDWFVLHGGRVDTNNVAIPGRASGSLAADGNAKNRSVGDHGNPYSRVLPNVWDCPELRAIGYTSSTKLAPTDAVQSISPADTKFRHSGTSGSNKYLAFATALTGDDKTNMEAYVA